VNFELNHSFFDVLFSKNSLKIDKVFTIDNKFSVSAEIKTNDRANLNFCKFCGTQKSLKIAAACTLPCLFSQQWKIGELAWHVLEDVKMSPSVT